MRDYMRLHKLVSFRNQPHELSPLADLLILPDSNVRTKGDGKRSLDYSYDDSNQLHDEILDQRRAQYFFVGMNKSIFMIIIGKKIVLILLGRDSGILVVIYNGLSQDRNSAYQE